jgi:hypothetical protein
MATTVWRSAGRWVLAALLLSIAGIAQSRVIYDVGYDPDHVFVGFAQLEVDEGCLTENGGGHSTGEGCSISLVWANMEDSAGNDWTSGPQELSSDSFTVVGNNLFSIETSFFLHPVSDLFLASRVGIRSSDCSGLLTMFDNPSRDATFCGSNGTDFADYTITRVPEPGTLALLAGAFGAAWFGRRKSRR